MSNSWMLSENELNLCFHLCSLFSHRLDWQEDVVHPAAFGQQAGGAGWISHVSAAEPGDEHQGRVRQHHRAPAGRRGHGQWVSSGFFSSKESQLLFLDHCKDAVVAQVSSEICLKCIYLLEATKSWLVQVYFWFLTLNLLTFCFSIILNWIENVSQIPIQLHDFELN